MTYFQAAKIERENYLSETHLVTTEDGYMLTIYRIPGPPGSKSVLLQHGLLASSESWTVAGRGFALAYILSDQGYDVWMGNFRGNTYSKKHIKLSTSDPLFWDFSMHELGIYDLPAIINYITELRNDNLFYISHSLGAPILCIMAVERPEVSKKVKAMVGLAPATYSYRMQKVMKFISPFSRELKWIANSLGIYEFLPHSIIWDLFAKYICRSVILRGPVCEGAIFSMAGLNLDQLNQTLLPKIWSQFPAGTSVKLVFHFLQQTATASFQNYDYGVRKNLKVYGNSKPPIYNLSKVQVPIAVFTSQNDWLIVEKDAMEFYDEIPIKIGIHEVEDKDFNHFDYLWATDAPNLVYSKVLDILKNQTSV
ncbi:hypothetical protein QAD02_011508 [Eretmocerus hayati]|uniref:Uncharacterized protein n=1 Tax=Eretmocerus hayati TaxID=131215 RepID=A0ACC2NX74_9HYME|nr:hypothetical protein QAD02_011508 [Eretmocerus hayati]